MRLDDVLALAKAKRFWGRLGFDVDWDAPKRFTFSRSKRGYDAWGWSVGLWAGTHWIDCAYHLGAPHPRRKADAVKWAKGIAEQYGFQYVEYREEWTPWRTPRLRLIRGRAERDRDQAPEKTY